jgi:hypothetical protein
MLQSLPADVLAAVLACDTLTATSENTVLAAVDAWLAGPLAATLAAAQQSSGIAGAASGDAEKQQQACGAAGIFCLQNACAVTQQRSGSAGSGGYGGSMRSNSCGCASVREGMQESPHTAAGGGALYAAQRLLLGCVRLPQCSGAFLAAAVQHMPWMCGALQHKGQELEWLQEYYRCVACAPLAHWHS